MGAQGTDPDAGADAARAALVREIAVSGAFDGDPSWREVFEQVPRHVFVPYYYLPAPTGYRRLWREDPDPRERSAGCAAHTPTSHSRPGCATVSWCRPAASRP